MRIKEIVLGILLFILLSACQEGAQSIEQHYAYPPLALKQAKADTIAGYLINYPSAGMDSLNDDELSKWINAQKKLTRQELLTDQATTALQFFSNNPQFIDFPILYQDQFYALIQTQEGQGIYKSNDLSTLSSYLKLLDKDSLTGPESNWLALKSHQNLLSILYRDHAHKKNHVLLVDLQSRSPMLLDRLEFGPNYLIHAESLFFVSNEQGVNPNKKLGRYELKSGKYFWINSGDFLNSDLRWVGYYNNQIVLKEIRKSNGDKFWSYDPVKDQFQKLFSSNDQEWKWLRFHNNKHYFIKHSDTEKGQIYSYDSLEVDSLQLKEVFREQELLLIDAIANEDHIIAFLRGQQKESINFINYQGEIQESFPLDASSSYKALKHYNALQTSLLSRNKIGQGELWTAINPQAKIAAEEVYRSLSIKFESDIQHLVDSCKSYDGYPLRLDIFYNLDHPIDQNSSSLILSGISFEENFLHTNIYTDLLHNFLNTGGFLLIPSLRGDDQWGTLHQHGADAQRLQLRYDDLQASINFLNDNNWGASEDRILLGTEEGALAAAACLVQRPDLVQKVILQDGIYDLVNYARLDSLAYADPKSIQQDSLLFPVFVKSSPLHWVGAQDIPSQLLLINSEQLTFTERQQSYKFLAAIQQLSDSGGKKLFWQSTTKEKDLTERLIWNFMIQNDD